MKNTLGKTRPVERPYLTFRSNDGWEWRVLKSWQGDNAKPYARWFCSVSSPYTGGGSDMGDTYVADIVSGWAILVAHDLPEGTRIEDVLAGVNFRIA